MSIESQIRERIQWYCEGAVPHAHREKLLADILTLVPGCTEGAQWASNYDYKPGSLDDALAKQRRFGGHVVTRTVRTFVPSYTDWQPHDAESGETHE